MTFESAHPDDFDEIQNLYWDLIDKSKDEPSFPDWKKATMCGFCMLLRYDSSTKVWDLAHFLSNTFYHMQKQKILKQSTLT